MPATTLKLPAELKRRIAPLARRSGKTPHAWMVEALGLQADLGEQREAFLAEAEASARELDAGGPLYAMEDVHAYLRGKVAGRRVRRPAPLPASRR